MVNNQLTCKRIKSCDERKRNASREGSEGRNVAKEAPSSSPLSLPHMTPSLHQHFKLSDARVIQENLFCRYEYSGNFINWILLKILEFFVECDG